MAVVAKVAEVMAGVGSVGLSRTQGGPQFEFQDAAAVDGAVRPWLVKVGLVVLPLEVCVDDVASERLTRAGEMVRESGVRVRVRWGLVDVADGERVEVWSVGEGADAGGHAVVSALRVARRVLFQHLFLLESDEAGRGRGGLGPGRARGMAGGDGVEPRATDAQVRAIERIAAARGLEVGGLCDEWGVSTLQGLSKGDASRILTEFKGGKG